MLQHQEVKPMLLRMIKKCRDYENRCPIKSPLRAASRCLGSADSTGVGSGAVLGKLENASLAVLDSKVEILSREIFKF